MKSLESQILKHLKPLIGLKLSVARRAADLRNFQFGEMRKIEGGSVGDYALHIQCAWRVEGPNGIVTGRSDLWEPAEIDADIDWEEWRYDKNPNLQDKKIGEWLKGRDESTKSYANATDLLVVESIEADDFGGAKIHLSGGYRIVLFPAGTRGEAWRIFRPQTEDEHFVVEDL